MRARLTLAMGVTSVFVSLLHSLRFVVQSRASLQLEIIALRQQLAVVNRSHRPRRRFTAADQRSWVWLSSLQQAILFPQERNHVFLLALQPTAQHRHDD